MKKLSTMFREVLEADKDVEIVEDFYPVLHDMEAAALIAFIEKVSICAINHNLMPHTAILRIITEDGIDVNNPIEVENFFWQQGLDEESIKGYTNIVEILGC